VDSGLSHSYHAVRAIIVPTLIFSIISPLRIKSIECRAENAELRVSTLTGSSLRVIHKYYFGISIENSWLSERAQELRNQGPAISHER
jgi:hypothetical protein